jgi:hypothetical protein
LHEAHANEEIAQGVLVYPVADTGRKRGIAQGGTGGNPLGCGIERGQQDEAVGHPVHEGRQRRHPLGGNVGVGRHAIIGKAVPAGKGDDRHIGREKGQRRLHRRHPLVVARNMQDRHALGRDFRQQRAGIEAFGRARKRDMVGLGHGASIGLWYGPVNHPRDPRTCFGTFPKGP